MSTGWLHKEEATEEKKESSDSNVVHKGLNMSVSCIGKGQQSVKGMTFLTGVSAAGPAARARQEGVPPLGLGSGHRGTLARTEGPGMGEKVQRWHVKNRTDTRQYLGEVGAAHQTRQGSRGLSRFLPPWVHMYIRQGLKNSQKGTQCLGKNIFPPTLCVGTSDICIDYLATRSYRNRHHITKHVC